MSSPSNSEKHSSKRVIVRQNNEKFYGIPKMEDSNQDVKEQSDESSSLIPSSSDEMTAPLSPLNPSHSDSSEKLTFPGSPSGLSESSNSSAPRRGHRFSLQLGTSTNRKAKRTSSGGLAPRVESFDERIEIDLRKILEKIQSDIVEIKKNILGESLSEEIKYISEGVHELTQESFISPRTRMISRLDANVSNTQILLKNLEGLSVKLKSMIELKQAIEESSRGIKEVNRKLDLLIGELSFAINSPSSCDSDISTESLDGEKKEEDSEYELDLSGIAKYMPVAGSKNE